MTNLPPGLTKIVANINKKFPDSIVDLNKNPRDISYLSSTGSLGLDKALGGGVAKGRIFEIFGPESCGKSTLATHIAANTQKEGGVVVYIDYEHAFHGGYAQTLGVDLYNNFILCQPTSLEEGAEIIESVVESGEVALVIVDSVAAMSPDSEIENDMKGFTVGIVARRMGQILRKINPLCSKLGVTTIFINQLRENLNSFGYGDTNITPGGKALKFFASVRIEMKKMGFESETVNAIKKKTAQKVNCKVVKNKTYIPWEEADFQIEFGKGIVQSSEIVPLAISYGIIRKCTKNKVTGVYVEFDSPLWSKDEILDKNENDLVGTLEQGDMTWIAQEITLRVKNKLGGIADTDLPILVKRLDVEFNKIKLEHEEAMKQVADLTGKSKWLEAEPFIETAFYLKPWDTYTKQRYKVVKEKCEGLRISIQPKEEDINVESTPTENE